MFNGACVGAAQTGIPEVPVGPRSLMHVRHLLMFTWLMDFDNAASCALGIVQGACSILAKALMQSNWQICTESRCCVCPT